MLNIKSQLSNVNEKGFSLIELVVVLAIFLVIIGVTVDIFISVVQSQKRILEEQELFNQTSYAIEYMSTGLKMAKKDPDESCLGTAGNVYVLTHCNNGVLGACSGIKFINQLYNNACEEFFLDDLANPANPPLRETKNGSTLNLLSSKSKITNGSFVLNGDESLRFASDTDLVQPRVSILLDIETQSINQIQEKIIQTTISQRNLNVSPPPP